jgi:hypothetical protein
MIMVKLQHLHLLKQSQPLHPRPRALLSLLLAITVHLGSAFIPFITPQLNTATAMSTDASSHTKRNKEMHPASSLSAAESSSAEAEGAKETENEVASDGPLLLPPIDNDDPSIPKIQLGDTIAFEEMGPVIINADGTTRRIDNWDQMTKQEQEVAWRRISKRNAERRAALLEQQQQEKNGK